MKDALGSTAIWGKRRNCAKKFRTRVESCFKYGRADLAGTDKAAFSRRQHLPSLVLDHMVDRVVNESLDSYSKTNYAILGSLLDFLQSFFSISFTICHECCQSLQ